LQWHPFAFSAKDTTESLFKRPKRKQTTSKKEIKK
jgi:hypothetical protein